MTEPVPHAGWVADGFYGLAVFAAATVLGFVVLPPLGHAVGAFATASDAAAFFSWATLRGLPILAGLSLLSLLVRPWLARRRTAARALLFLLNVAVVWASAAAVAIALLG